GQIRSDLNMKFNPEYNDATYSGNLAMTQFNIGKYSDADSLLGTISFDTKIEGTGLKTDELDAKLSGIVQQFQFNGYDYQNLNVDGSFTKKLFTGKLLINDENINLDFTGLVDFNNDLPVYDFHAKINNANLGRLGFIKDEYLLSTNLAMNMKGDNIDNFIG